MKLDVTSLLPTNVQKAKIPWLWVLPSCTGNVMWSQSPDWAQGCGIKSDHMPNRKAELSCQSLIVSGKMNIWIFICMIRTNYNDHSISGQTLMFILMLWSGPCPVWYHLRAGVYCLYCSPPTGGDQAVLTSLLGSLHAVHLWYGAQFSH